MKIYINITLRQLVLLCILISCLIILYRKRPQTFEFNSNLRQFQRPRHYAKYGAADEHKLVDLPNFSYLIKQPACAKHTKVLILVHTAPNHFSNRRQIRNGWASLATAESALEVYFLLGKVSEQEKNSKDLQNQLNEENFKYSDLIQGSFVDNYRNLTYKHVMAFKWFLYECANAEVLIKVDDDVYVNTLQIRQYLHLNALAAEKGVESLQNKHLAAAQRIFHQPRNLMFCYVTAGPVERENNRYQVTYEQYARDKYPPYCSGYVILYSADVVERLYMEVQSNASPYISVDDAYITGIIAEKVNISATFFGDYFLHETKCADLIEGKTDWNSRDFLFASYVISAADRDKLWLLSKKTRKTSQ